MSTTRRVKVRLQWLTATPPNTPGERFTRPARFYHQNENWTSDAWSLVLEMEGSPDAQRRQIGWAEFLMPNAPQEWLAPGKRFELFAENPIGLGEVLD
jgi:hypothetical protein